MLHQVEVSFFSRHHFFKMNKQNRTLYMQTALKPENLKNYMVSISSLISIAPILTLRSR